VSTISNTRFPKRCWSAAYPFRAGCRRRPAPCQITSFRCRSNCQQLASAVDLRGVVEEALAENLVAAPFLQCDLVEAADLAGLVGQLEIPVDGDAFALDGGGHADRDHLGCALQHGALMRHQAVAADARRRSVLLHAGVFGVVTLDRAGMVAGDDKGDELVETGA